MNERILNSFRFRQPVISRSTDIAAMAKNRFLMFFIFIVTRKYSKICLFFQKRSIFAYINIWDEIYKYIVYIKIYQI